MKRRLDDSNTDGRNVKPKLAPAESLKLAGRALDWDTCRYLLCDFLTLDSYGTLWMTSKSHRDMLRRVLPLVTVAKAQSLYDFARDPVAEALGLSLQAGNCTSLLRLSLGYADLLGGRAGAEEIASGSLRARIVRLGSLFTELVINNRHTLRVAYIDSTECPITVFTALANCSQLRVLHAPSLDLDSVEEADYSFALQAIFAQPKPLSDVTLCRNTAVSEDVIVALLRAEFPLKNVKLEQFSAGCARYLGSESHRGLESLSIAFQAPHPFPGTPDSECLPELCSGLSRLQHLTKLTILFDETSITEPYVGDELHPLTLPRLTTLGFGQIPHYTGYNVPDLPIRAPELQTFHFAFVHLLPALDIAASAKNLLTIDGCEGVIDEGYEEWQLVTEQEAKMLISLLKEGRWPQLQQLDLQHVLPADAFLHFGHFTALSKVRLCVDPATPCANIRALLAGCPSLEYVYVAAEGTIPSLQAQLEQKASSSTAMETDRETKSNSTAVLKPYTLSKLTHLRLDIADDSVFGSCSMPLINDLILGRGVRLRDITAVLQGAKSLHVECKFTTSVDFLVAAAQAAAATRNALPIRALSMYNCPTLTDMQLLAICSACPQLDRLSVDNGQLTAQALLVICSCSMPKLTQLRLALAIPEHAPFNGKLFERLVSRLPSVFDVTLNWWDAPTEQQVMLVRQTLSALQPSRRVRLTLGTTETAMLVDF